MDRIGVRELRQNASRYLARVASGETLEITDRGRPIAMLVPLSSDLWRDLLSSGRVAPPEDDGDIADEAPRDYGVAASKELERIRRHER